MRVAKRSQRGARGNVPAGRRLKPSADALHEAGHCVVSAHYGYPGTFATIEPTPEYDGRFSNDWPEIKDLPRDISETERRRAGEMRCAVALAGALAQTRGRYPWGSPKDQGIYDEGLGLLSLAPDGATILRWTWVVRRILGRRIIWRAVLRVASALDAERTLGAARIRQLVGRIPLARPRTRT